MNKKPIWRTVQQTGTHYNPGYGKHWAVGGNVSIMLIECGHTTARKLSSGVPKRAHCQECTRLRNGVIWTETASDGTRVRVSWNSETQLPKRETLA